MNSGIHYAGLVNTRYKEVGVAVGHGAAGTSFVIVFGDPGGPEYVPPAAAGSGSGGGAPQAPPSYVVGVDAHGNIKHQIQSGDTLGQIALIYGYTWNDIPGMLALNGMSEADYRKLKEGEIFLVPPKAGTFTPTPADAVANASPDPALVATTDPNIPTPYPEEALSLSPDPVSNANITATFPPTLTPVMMVATANSVPNGMVAFQPTSVPSQTVQGVAMVSTNVPVMDAGVLPNTSGTPSWLGIALVVQVVVLVGAGCRICPSSLATLVMNQVQRYLRAFWGALRLTLRGEKIAPPSLPASPLTTWISQYSSLVDAVLRAADQNGINQAARKQAKLRLDGRQMSLETALLTLKFHAAEEYPSLVRQGEGRGVQNTLYATNMNDRYWISKMAESPDMQKPDVQTALSELDKHLDNIPRL